MDNGRPDGRHSNKHIDFAAHFLTKAKHSLRSEYHIAATYSHRVLDLRLN